MEKDRETCKYCFGEGYLCVDSFQPITHEMALDAGNPDLEGLSIYEGYDYVPCPYCEEPAE